jgi:hypothetical protein
MLDPTMHCARTSLSRARQIPRTLGRMEIRIARSGNFRMRYWGLGELSG